MKKFEKAQLEIILFDDVITTSSSLESDSFSQGDSSCPQDMGGYGPLG